MGCTLNRKKQFYCISFDKQETSFQNNDDLEARNLFVDNIIFLWSLLLSSTEASV